MLHPSHNPSVSPESSQMLVWRERKQKKKRAKRNPDTGRYAKDRTALEAGCVLSSIPILLEIFSPRPE